MIVVLVDLDDRPNCLAFQNQMTALLQHIPMQPPTLFRIAIEELESWFLADPAAIRAAYPGADLSPLANYLQDSQCRTWELLHRIVHPDGKNTPEKADKVPRRQHTCHLKRQWAAKISPHLDVDNTPSKSFQAFRDGLRRHA